MGDSKTRRSETSAAGAILSDRAQAALADPRVFRTAPGVSVVRAEIGGRWIFFSVANPDDRIQRKHSRGKFYEADELAEVGTYFPAGGVFCDVGANVGNHSLYALTRLGASQVIPFEPNPAAYELYLSNMILNGVIDRVETGTLGYGLTDRDDGAQADLSLRENNLGATRLVVGAGGIPLRTGDSLLAGRRIDFLKMDVEGMEMLALRGLEQTLRTTRPAIYLEIEHVNRAEFADWMARLGYGIAVEGRRFKHNQNLLIIPNA